MYKDIVQCCYIVIDFITIVLRKLLQYRLRHEETLQLDHRENKAYTLELR